DADGARYAAALDALIADPESDALLVMNVPTALASAADAAQAVIAGVRQHREALVRPKPVFAVWGGGSVNATSAFGAAGIPSFATEADAVRGFMHLVRYREAIDALLATPPSLPEHFAPDVAAARRIIERALNERGKGDDDRVWLDPIEITALLAAYAIP